MTRWVFPFSGEQVFGSFPFSARISLVIMMLLSGCVPAPLGTYYKPAYPDPSVLYTLDSCHGQAGAPVQMSIPLSGGVVLIVDAHRTYDERNQKALPLHLSLSIPKGTRVRFLRDEIGVSSHPEGERQRLPVSMEVSAEVGISASQVVDMEEVSPTPELFSDDPSAVGDFRARVSMYYSWSDGFVPRSFVMTLPGIERLDSEASTIPETQLRATAKRRPDSYPGEYKNSTSLIYTTRESEASLANRYAKCIEQGSGARCNRIPIHDLGVFELTRDGFDFSGRWYVFNVEERSPFNGELTLEYSRPLRWRFLHNRLRLTELPGRTERQYVFASFPLNLRYRIPFRTVVQGINNTPYGGNTTIRIQGVLGEVGSGKYFIHLPPLLIDGGEYRLQPIVLERHIFDFGILPFNC